MSNNPKNGILNCLARIVGLPL